MYNPSLEKDLKRLERRKLISIVQIEQRDLTLPTPPTFFLFHCMPRAAFYIKGHNRPAIDKNFL